MKVPEGMSDTVGGEEKEPYPVLKQTLALLLLAVTVAQALPSAIKADETVVFFPTFGWQSRDSTWELEVHGWIYEPAERTVAIKLLQLLRRALGLGDLSEAEEVMFEERARLFLVDNERGKKIVIRLGDSTFALPRSQANGHVTGRVRLNAEEAARLSTNRSGSVPAIRLQTTAKDGRVFAGIVHLLSSQGISVISDIDDTLKESHVRNREELLKNTFARPFKAVSGMAAVYAAWASKGASFHYVSASPWQLYQPLTEFMRTSGFPAGTFHFKLFRWKDATVFDLFASPQAHKHATISRLLQRFGARRFILVGDSGEQDPEIYGALARRYPQQILRIFIRDVTGETAGAERYRKAFAGLPAETWVIFRDPQEIKT